MSVIKRMDLPEGWVKKPLKGILEEMNEVLEK